MCGEVTSGVGVWVDEMASGISVWVDEGHLNTGPQSAIAGHG